MTSYNDSTKLKYSRSYSNPICIEKLCLRRQKEQFSDGVGYNWIDELKRWCDKYVTDEQLQSASVRFPHDTPTTKEAYYYRHLFEFHFPQPACLGTVMRWIPRKDWGCPEDPSGRAQRVHGATIRK